MRRYNAAVLTVVLAAFVLLPYLPLLADSESNLPPCCRRNGSHHCALRMMRRPDDGRMSFRTAACRCPFQKALTPGCRLALYPANRVTVRVALLPDPALHLQTVLAGLISKSRSHQKRGPPFLHC